MNSSKTAPARLGNQNQSNQSDSSHLKTVQSNINRVAGSGQKMLGKRQNQAKTPNTKSHDLHLLAMKGLISYYESMARTQNSSKIINNELLQMNSSVFESRKPKFYPNMDYLQLLIEEVGAQEQLKTCLGESLIQIDEIQREYDCIANKSYEIELKINPKWKKRRKNYELKKAFQVRHILF